MTDRTSDDADNLRMGDIDADALKVVRKLLAAGHEAYLVGGCVRDLYLGIKPKDFDVATSARPEQIRRVFRNSRIIGRRFKLAHVYFGAKIIETSTFRAPPSSAGDDEMLITQDNEWGSVEDDARRRDFTINGLFFDVDARDIVDFVDGMDDLDRGVIRTIGDPWVRLQEDPVRMIRAIKFAARLDFALDDACRTALVECAPAIAKCSRARLLEELYKLLRGGACRRSFELMLEWKLLEHLWPQYLDLYDRAGGLHAVGAGSPGSPSALLWRYLDALDTYVRETGQTPTNGVVQAVLFAPLLDEAISRGGAAELDVVIDDLMTPACTALGVARRDRELARQIFMAQKRLAQSGRRRRASLLQREYFHDALIFLGITVAAREDDEGELHRWRELARLQTAGAVSVPERKKPRPRKRRGRRRSGGRASAGTATPTAAD